MRKHSLKPAVALTAGAVVAAGVVVGGGAVVGGGGTVPSGGSVRVQNAKPVSVDAAAAGVPAAAGPTSGALFNNSNVAAEKNKLVQQLQTLIDGASPGSEIRMSVFDFRSEEIADALIAAAKRQVKVKVLADSVNVSDAEKWKAFARLRKAIGTDDEKSSWAITCMPKGKACIGTGDSPHNHNKFTLFSNTLGASKVVVQSSANLTPSVGGLGGWNSSYAVAGNDSFYNEYMGYFADLKEMKKDSNYYDTRDPKEHGNVKTYFYPRSGDDTVVNQLGYVSCHGNTTGGTGDNHRTIVRVSMWHLGRTAVAKKLWELDAKGCYVDIVANYIDDDARRELNKPAGGYKGPVVRGFRAPDKEGVHEKNILIDGVYKGVINQRLVFTGSHNLNFSSLRENDETTLKINDETVHAQFRQNFWDIRAATNCTFTPSSTPCPSEKQRRVPIGDDGDS